MAATTRTKKAAAEAAPAAEVETADRPLEGNVVVPAELQFTTPKKDRAVTEDVALPFTLDGEVYTIIAPAKLEETLAPLIAAGARAADESDVLFASAAFLQRVIAPESLIRINRRLADPKDDFELGDLFDQLEKIAVFLLRNRTSGAAGRGPVPARRRR